MEMFLSDSDYDSSSDSCCSDYPDDSSMYGGQAQSILSSLERSIGKIDDFLAFDTGFIHGDIVCSETDRCGQLGKVVDVDLVVELETVQGQIIRDVSSKKLEKIRSFVIGNFVLHGPWIGRVSRVVDSVVILFDDGAKCQVIALDPENLIPVSPNLFEDSQYPYYPGQRVWTRDSNVFKSARWLCGGWKENRAEGIVYHVEAGLVYVDWVASALVGHDLTVPSPPCLQDATDLTLLSCFSHVNWELGDWCVLNVDNKKTVEEHVSIADKVGHIELGHGPRQTSSDSGPEKLYVIVKRKAKIDILWQDGTSSIGLDPQAVFPVHSVDDHEFWPEQFVLEKGTCDDLHTSSSRRLGIVESMDTKERTVKLTWKSHPGNQTDDSGGEYKETVSAYELIEHPDYSYALGDIVFRLEKTHFVVQGDGYSEFKDHKIREMSLHQLGQDNLTRKETSNDRSEFPDKQYLSSVGNVIGYKDEGIIVRWATGVTSKVGPHEIAGIDKYEVSIAAPVPLEEDIGDSLNKEMTIFEKQVANQKEKDVLENPDKGVGDDHAKNMWKSSSFFLCQSAIGFLTNVTTSLFGSRGSTSLSGSSENKDSYGISKYQNLDSNTSHPEEDDKIRSVFKKEVTEHCRDEESLLSVNCLWRNREHQVEAVEDNQQLSYSSSCKGSGQLKQFDIVGDFSDHHFAYGAERGSIGQVKRGFLKKVQREWSFLEKDLPETIYVRAYEERIDLLRAAIFGAPGTPYHDGIFFFDFLLPPDYPHEPPLVHFNSGGLRLNPNLYESGRVCLSLLNTWTGTGTEMWNPGSSTILQVLLSLQALVLTEKPYFNEAGYDQQVGRADGEKNSITYNENAFLISCKYMLYILRKPPKQFETLVEDHFCRHAQSILLACKAYMDGATVGCAFGSGRDNSEKQRSNSTGFKLMLAKLLPMLVSGFTEKGIDCGQFRVEMIAPKK